MGRSSSVEEELCIRLLANN